MSLIDVDSYRIEQAGSDIATLTGEIKSFLDNTFDLIENMIVTTEGWQGDSAQSFLRTTRAERKDYTVLINECNQFANHLIGYANNMKSIGDSVKK